MTILSEMANFKAHNLPNLTYFLLNTPGNMEKTTETFKTELSSSICATKRLTFAEINFAFLPAFKTV